MLPALRAAFGVQDVDFADAAAMIMFIIVATFTMSALPQLRLPDIAATHVLPRRAVYARCFAARYASAVRRAIRGR